MTEKKAFHGGKAVSSGTWDSILLRDSLDDNGTIPNPTDSPCTSPDVICTRQQQVDPSIFTQNYSVNPGLDPFVNQNNFFYVRGKNLGAQPSDGTVYLFWCPSSLLMTPNQWTQNVMQANIGGQWQPYNIFPSVNNSQIAVTQSPFVWSPVPPPAGQHYCLIGAVSTPVHPWSTSSIPPFPTWDDFVAWVRNNGNVCWRNMTLASNPNQPVWDRLDLLTNPGATPVVLMVTAACTNVPVGTTVTLQNDELGITSTQVTTDPNQTIFSKGATCPVSYNGYVQTLATLAPGQSWPTGATIKTTLWFGTTSDRPVAKYAHNFGADAKHPNLARTLQLAGGKTAGVLVAVGSCSTRMQPAVTC